MGSCLSSGISNVPPIELNIHSEPNEEEKEIHATLTKLLSKQGKLIKRLSEYSGCEKYIRNALSEPTPETEEEAWNAVEKSVALLYKFYVYTLRLDESLEGLLLKLCEEGEPERSVRNRQATIGCLAAVLRFAINFDRLKMSKPSIQNDFSYYRRALSRMCTLRNESSASKMKLDLKVNEDVANKMSFHFAYPVPTMKVLSDRVTQLKKINYIPTLSLIANLCCVMVNNQNLSKSDRKSILSLMAGCIIFVDHIAPGGVFNRKSSVYIKQCLNAIRYYGGADRDSLFNEIRFASLHLKDETTPAYVTRFFE
ncbi:CYFIP-related Rac1 interactor homolog isoform X2 [Schistocerca gregaria]|nr:CYFIP-related Rac1 interactor homolog isoform X2 [Schistocerca gregaria]XP_049851373.1 CYFIP-related Rac1 interactor homolog isoform X2 [Schistocerca gregaria]